MTAEFSSRISATITQYRMLEPGEKVMVGVSGGPDSTALLHALHHLKNHLQISLAVAHYNHGLRGDAANRDAHFVQEQAENLGLAVTIGTDEGSLARKRGNLEERARIRRYEFFSRAAQETGSHKIALGHTANDQAETLFLWLLRGAGRRGVGGIPPVRDNIIRPLIDVERKQVVQFLTGEEIAWIEDPTNRETHILRNRIRHVLIPLLEKEFEPQTIKILRTASEVLRDEDTWIDELTRDASHCLMREKKGGEVSFAVAEFLTLPVALQRRLVRRALEKVKGSLRKITFAHVEAVLSLLVSSSPHARVSLPDGFSAEREYGTLQFGKRSGEAVAFRHSFETLPKQVVISEINRTITFEIVERSPNLDVTGSADTGFIDLKAVKFPMVVRNVRSGDRFCPIGLEGSKKVKDFFIDQKIPVKKRKRIPLVVFGDVIAWIGGCRVDDRVKLTEKTRAAVKMVLV
jgi:tRNA(Ile)-lysidine synthase